MQNPGTPEARSGWGAIREEPDEIPGVSPEHRAVEDVRGNTLCSIADIAPGEGPVSTPDRSGWDAIPNDNSPPIGEGSGHSSVANFDQETGEYSGPTYD